MSAAENEIVIPRKDRDPLTFQSANDVEAFLEREILVWSWTVDTPDTSHSVVNSTRNGYRPSWMEGLKPFVTEWRKSGDIVARQSAVDQLNGRFNDGRRLSADDQEAVALSSLAETDKRMAMVALATVVGAAPIADNQFLLQSRVNRAGVARGLAILADVDQSTIRGVKKSLGILKTQSENDASSFRTQMQEFAARTEVISNENRAAADALNRAHEQEFSTAEESRTKQFGTLKEALEAVKDAYEVRMELQGPVRYWQKKAKRHKTAKWISGVILVVYAVSSVIALHELFEQAAAHLPTSTGDQIPFALLFKAGAFALLMSSIAFWIGRVLLRIFLSNQHLATDADERMTMVMTFLALVRRKAIKDEDRAAILTPLFRAGSDGIVKEESAPDTALAAFLSAVAKK